jgi:transposase
MRKSKYSKEFKDSTVQLILNDGESVVKVADDLGLNSKTLYHWVTSYKKAHNIPTRDVNASSKESDNEELKRLRRENKILKQERDILKKAAAYFAKETL